MREAQFALLSQATALWQSQPATPSRQKWDSLAGSFARGHLCLGSDCSKKFRVKEAGLCAVLPYFSPWSLCIETLELFRDLDFTKKVWICAGLCWFLCCKRCRKANGLLVAGVSSFVGRARRWCLDQVGLSFMLVSAIDVQACVWEDIVKMGCHLFRHGLLFSLACVKEGMKVQCNNRAQGYFQCPRNGGGCTCVWWWV